MNILLFQIEPHFNKATCILIVGLIIDIQLVSSTFCVSFHGKNKSQSNINFWHANMNDFSVFRPQQQQQQHQDERLSHIADQIEQIGVLVNQSTSQCYRLLERAFRNGWRHQWSAKRKCNGYIYIYIY